MKRLMVFLFVAMALAGCRSTGPKPVAGGPEEKAAAAKGLGEEESGAFGSEEEGAYEPGAFAPGGGYAGSQDAGPKEGLLGKRVIYFDFDSAQIRSEFIPVIEAHARYLASRPGVKVVLEGHTDERGSPEYNIALGEARAKSVAKALELNGTAGNQINIVSYGEEKPVALGHDEASWSQNRRVEIVYREY
ncbi:MAG: peptidoglycan-associated lipoprotein Pal [Methylohalobius sp.]|nr:peptidoglycan-associated lipoprotein Pal [Methylohalobius sp.]